MAEAKESTYRGFTEAQARAHRRYISRFVEVKVRMEPKRRNAIKSHAEGRGESVNGFINRAIDNQISQDRDKGPCEALQGPSGGGGISLHQEALQTAQEAAQKARETVSQFVERAVDVQAKRDEVARKMEGAHGG